MPDTHDERGGDADPYDWDPVYAAATIDRLQKALAVATARAEKAEARLAERQPIRAEWSTENALCDPGDDPINQELARRRVAEYPNIHTAVLRRQLYAGPWVPADKACRSCGETDGVLGDPPRCANCAVYAPAAFTGLLAAPKMAPDAAPDGRSATLRAGDASGGAFQANTSSILPQGLSEPEDGRVTSVWCWAPNPNGPLRCGRLRDHEPPHRRGERTWTDDDTTEDDRG
jgi:hypothetical protein